jgi:hypothetical protein
MNARGRFAWAAAVAGILGATSCTGAERDFAPPHAVGGEPDAIGGNASSLEPGQSGEGGAALSGSGAPPEGGLPSIGGSDHGGAPGVGGEGAGGSGGEGGSSHEDPCPSGQAKCGNACVDILSSDEHCGGACEVCSEAFPRCSSGACVECLVPTDCSAPGSVCGADHACDCRPQKPSNVLVDSGFASELDLADWSPSRGASWSTEDADACSGSGSVRLAEVTSPIADLGSISQCAVASADTNYRFGIRAKPGSWSCQLTFYTGASCGGTASSTAPITQLSAYNGWGTTYGARKAPPNTASVELSCQTGGPGPDHIDQIFLNATGDGY